MRKLLLLSILFCLPAIGIADPLRVFASVIPIQTFVEKIGGEYVDARVMVRPGFNPHTYDPTPQQIAALAESALYVRTGVPFENAWMERIQSASPDMQVLDARDGIKLREMEAHDHDDHGHDDKHHAKADHDHGHDGHDKHKKHDGHESHKHDHHDHDHHDKHKAHADHDSHKGHHHGHEEQDPHVWTSPALVKHMIGNIRDKLSELAPEHAEAFASNHDAFADELEGLDRELHSKLDPLPNRRFMVFHPAWGYFADSYGLTQVSIEREGKEPGARGLAALIEQAKQDKIRVVFVQPQFDQRQARQVAQAIDGGVIAVDPLAANYVDNLREVGRQFAGALQP